MDGEKYTLGNVALLSGEILLDAHLAFKTYGRLNRNNDNVVVLPTFYTGSHHRNEGFFGVGSDRSREAFYYFH
jgi:homoserine O-acetyltransferase